MKLMFNTVWSCNVCSF